LIGKGTHPSVVYSLLPESAIPIFFKAMTNETRIEKTAIGLEKICLQAILDGQKVYALLPDGSYDRIYAIGSVTALGKKTRYFISDVQEFTIAI
jgi:hypothetical protein